MGEEIGFSFVHVCVHLYGWSEVEMSREPVRREPEGQMVQSYERWRPWAKRASSEHADKVPLQQPPTTYLQLHLFAPPLFYFGVFSLGITQPYIQAPPSYPTTCFD